MRALALALPLVFALVPRPAAAQHPDVGEGRIRHHPEFLVTTEWLARRLQSPDVVVVQVGRSDAAYLAGHVPGARFLPLSAVATTENGLPNEFPPAAQLVETFRALGVGRTARIVLYGDEPLLAARAWVALDLLGQSGRAALLAGGLGKWTAERRPVETGSARAVGAPNSAEPAPFTGAWRADGVVTAAWVRAHLGDSAVFFVDARSQDLFTGAEGHLPGAHDIFWMTALDSATRAPKPMHTLHEGIWKAAGADRPAVNTVVTYCQTGMQASFDYFVARYVGYSDVRLYDGSLAEWTRLGMPVERSSH